MTKLAVKKGDRLTFKGYESLEEGMEPLFKKGDILIAKKVTETDQEGVLKIHAYSEAEGADSDVDTLYYPGEVGLAKAEKTKAKAKAAPVEDEDEDDQDVEDEEIEEDDAEEGDDEAEEDAEDDTDDEDAVEEDEVEEDEAPAPKRAVKASTKTAKAAAKEKPVKETKEKAKKAKAVPARTKDEEQEEEIHHMKSVAKIIKKSDDILDAAKNLVTQAEQTYFNLGGILAEIYRTKAYGEAGYTGEGAWDAYLSQELGLEYRKAMYLIEIYKAFSKLDVDEARLASIGWTKIRLLAKHIKGLSQEDVDSLLDEAENMNRDELSEHIQETLVDASKGGKKEKIKKVKFGGFSAFADEGEYIGAAIERAQELVEGGDYQAAMKHIIREWAVSTDGVDVSLEDAIAVVEARFGVTLKVVDGDDGESEEAPVKAKAKKEKAEKPAKAKAEKAVAVAKPVAKKAEKAAPVKGKKKAA
jgi:hypothetical protein